MTEGQSEQAKRIEDAGAALRLRFAKTADWVRELRAWFAKHILKIVLFLALLVLGSVLMKFASVATSRELPQGMLTLEFMGTKSNGGALQQAVRAAPQVRGEVVRAVWVDFALIVFYTVLLYRGIRFINGRYPGLDDGQPRMVHRFAPWAAMGAGVFDVLENLGILAVVQRWFNDDPLHASIAVRPRAFVSVPGRLRQDGHPRSVRRTKCCTRL